MDKKRHAYFVKQKLLGLCMVVISILIACIVKGESVCVPIVFVPMGLMFIFSKDMYIQDDYYWEVMEKKQEKEWEEF